MFLSLEVRSYERKEPHLHHHEHAQLVLPIRGEMEIDVNGRGGCIDQSLAALVKPGSVHSQHSDVDSRFLVLDCAPTILETLQIGRLARRIYVPIPPATRRLIEFADLIGNAQLSIAASQLAPLLLSSLNPDISCFSDPMEQLIARLRADPGANWSNEAMAQVAKMSMSQLHQRFRLLFEISPQAWLTRLRIQEAQRWLRGTSLPISEIALRAGFSDQASLTRTMQRVSATTPAAYRKAQKQFG
ncbi:MULTISPECIES: AraC family transcriptional regulator [Pseudomonas]|uniref:Transcriptional regulator, AraC family n=4 Tax=Pseudomonas syringae TaxID=317 RepID=Q4ZY04_PSEU2|nr:MULTISPECIES: AraC family transcriptional regulator [Pseudomonas]AAY35968.1 transcriptional regulator, AraC family [Pseudomonas syringae pv. syringae B728a]AKF44501.1 transcriptional regulator, AraC family [Pseudomonas syringae pv. syringae B301D]EXL29888.1 AraC family transcriptional regulator [Pseudomonas syringae pv. syringae str. B301D-R]KTB76533.1 AraC family transcriptional regulator [Pseudomonas syringae pv. syringae PD2774]KWS24095.1 AraC family transcriptional regulator [Pseudomona